MRGRSDDKKISTTVLDEISSFTGHFSRVARQDDASGISRGGGGDCSAHACGVCLEGVRRCHIGVLTID